MYGGSWLRCVRLQPDSLDESSRASSARTVRSASSSSSSKSFNAPKLKADRVHRAISPFGSFDVVQRFGWQGDFHTQVGLMNRRNAWIKWAVRVAVVNVLDVDTTGTGALLHQG